jgi:hypothetical protein
MCFVTPAAKQPFILIAVFTLTKLCTATQTSNEPAPQLDDAT